MNTLSTTRTITIGRCFLRKIMNNEGAIVSSTTAVHHYHHPHRSVDVGRGGDVVQRNSIMTMATGIHKRKLSSKVDVFHTINHNGKHVLYILYVSNENGGMIRVLYAGAV